MYMYPFFIYQMSSGEKESTNPVLSLTCRKTKPYWSILQQQQNEEEEQKSKQTHFRKRDKASEIDPVEKDKIAIGIENRERDEMEREFYSKRRPFRN